MGIIMSRKPEIDPFGNASPVVAIRFARDIIHMLDLLTDNRSEFVREATTEKIAKEMEKRK